MANYEGRCQTSGIDAIEETQADCDCNSIEQATLETKQGQ
jgi:hypothetical protein